MADKALLLREWLTLAFFLAFFFSILMLSFFESFQTDHLIMNSCKDEIMVYIEGEVDNPGLYSVSSGTTHIEALRLAGIRNSSNLKTIECEKIACDGDRIRVRSQKLIKVRLQYPDTYLEEIEVPKGAKIDCIEECIGDISLKVAWNFRRKTLREGDIIALVENHE